ncbi:hypothetical protein H6G20_20845 [Desertifilum sp. FACHB-1129]|uniref:Uncharacterized protein n=2 Tax=Desertifilum tharense IPPAS B-1220 TaxID=1781255 RepID=A0A1E5QG72_9CYAN|nr:MULTISPECIES: hypothetical protein [Desertifilum]MDA0213641.1 hypothetical protein [Cyanobacteria bacterium FC1]MBD2314122.1 hypothetical protein [Desertifilum sp. FACHB-1129]MBD2323608.1 hypothetical protein [Desertifilum sp. FACHB-866]MBD2335060.1 hypothetical protein [Desertifilum sp. FACHB-868]OEJ73587.1 hypothetical protein BH720_18980 [Desertifilum tharense IPPAS B-1220]
MSENRLEQILNTLDRLTVEEQWQVMGHLMNQLQDRAVIISKSQYENYRVAEAERILRDTEGSNEH